MTEVGLVGAARSCGTSGNPRRSGSSVVVDSSPFPGEWMLVLNFSSMPSWQLPQVSAMLSVVHRRARIVGRQLAVRRCGSRRRWP